MSLLDIQHLTVQFKTSHGFLRAVDDVSFEVKKGTTVGLVGESGSGKTTTGRAIVRLVEAHEGSICYQGEEITHLNRRGMMPYRKKIQIIFQDPYNSLNPRLTVESILSEPLEIHFSEMNRADRRARIHQLLEMVGLSKEHIFRYPHEFSGGQRQRIGIARALAVEPEFIICDEPVSALDVSVQAQIINLLQDLQQQLGLTYLFIAHDLAVVEHVSDDVLVMYQGKIVEHADAEAIYRSPQHPYTQKLLAAVPQF
ncbi:MAG: ATP-binding cassette domain-containing protein [Verrucomicrobiota bacterium]